MPNMSSFASEKPTRRMWGSGSEPQLEAFLGNFAIPASGSIQYFDGQAVGRIAGNIVQMDDTAAAEFVGFETDVIAPSLIVYSTDTLGDKRAKIHRPYAFEALIASCALGDETRRVYWLYNNQVAYSTTNLNFAGTVLGILDATHVLVLAPWLSPPSTGDSGNPTQAAFATLAASGAVAPSVQRNYLITKAGVAALTLAAPVVTTDDGKTIVLTSTTAFAHTLTATGLLLTGSAAVNTATFAAFAGTRLVLTAYQGKWLAVSDNGITFS